MSRMVAGQQPAAHDAQAVMERLRVVSRVESGWFPGLRIGPVSRPMSICMIVTPVSDCIIENRPLNRGGAAVFRKQGGVNVEATVTRQIQNGRRQYLAIGGHGDEVGLQAAEFPDEIFGAGALGLQYRQVQAQGERFDWRRLQFQIPSLRPVRLGGHRHHSKSGVFRQRSQTGASQLRRAHEEDA